MYESYRITGMQTERRTDIQACATEIIYYATSRLVRNAGHEIGEQLSRREMTELCIVPCTEHLTQYEP